MKEIKDDTMSHTAAEQGMHVIDKGICEVICVMNTGDPFHLQNLMRSRRLTSQ